MSIDLASPSKRPGRLRAIYVRWLPAVLGVTVVTNFALLALVPAHSQPLRRSDGGSLTDLVRDAQPTTSLRFGFYLDLGDAIDGGLLIVPPDHPLDTSLLQGLAQIEVEIAEYDPSQLDAELIPTTDSQGLVQVGDGEVPYWILPANSTERWWLAEPGDGIVVVPDSLALVPESP